MTHSVTLAVDMNFL